MTSKTFHRRILVTGCGGQLGSALCRLLDAEAVGLDLPELDIASRESVRAAVDRFRPEVVVNTAAYTQVDRAESEGELCRAVNVGGVENLVAACRNLGARFVQISTDFVFDGRQGSPYCELNCPNPLNVYGRSKWEAEQIVAEYPDHLIIRTAGLFGSGGPASRGNFVDNMLRRAGQGFPLRVVDDQISSFTFAGDLALAIRSLLAIGGRGVFHVANAGYGSWYQLATEVFRVAGVRDPIEPVPMGEYACAAQRPRFSVLDTGKYVRTPGCYRMPSWQQAVRAHLARRLARSPC
ncbi:MAG: dTDP-4-dehydrorhamnose reductase [Planctomycetaceae bacterium]|nr:dTDP-4-dehydrorhamnose reductase [Planctomycetaceae bacterium]